MAVHQGRTRAMNAVSRYAIAADCIFDSRTVHRHKAVLVEGALIAHPAVLESAVVGHADADELVKPKAYVVLKSGYQPSDALMDELKTFV